MQPPSNVTRFFARIIDYSLFIIAVDFICEASSVYFTDLTYFVMLFSIPLLWVPFETLFLKFFGKTPGKWITGLQVCARGKKPSLLEAWTRSFLTGIFSTMMLIPGLNIYLIYRGVKKKAFPWDSLTHLNVKGYPNRFRLILAPLVSLGLLTTIYFEDEILEHSHKTGLLPAKSSKHFEGWGNYPSEKGHFTISFPSKPDSISQDLPIPKSSQTLPYEEMTYKSGEDYTYSVSYTILPTKWIQWKAGLVLKGVLKVVNTHKTPGKIQKKLHTTHEKNPALDYWIKNGNEETRGRLILMGNYLYKVEMRYVPDDVDSEDIDATLSNFVSSFHLSKK